MDADLKEKMLYFVTTAQNKGYYKEPMDLQGLMDIQNYLKEGGVKQVNTLKAYRSAKGGKFKIVNGNEMLTRETSKFPYLVNKLVPEKAITSITADSGQGKSIIALILARHISMGQKLFGEFEVKKTKVLIIDQEQDEDLIIGRYKSIVREKSDIHFLYGQLWVINKDENYDWLVAEIKINNYGLLILDTLTTIHDKDENKADQMRQINNLLLQLITDTGITIIYLHHHRKRQMNEKMGQASSRGSTEIIAKVASHLLVTTKKDANLEGFMTLQMIISQEKARRPESIIKIGVDISYNLATKETSWVYKGEINEEEKRIEKATKFILGLVEQENSEFTINQFMEKNKEQGGAFGASALRSACRQLVKEKLISVRQGTGKQHSTNFYSLKKS